MSLDLDQFLALIDDQVPHFRAPAAHVCAIGQVTSAVPGDPSGFYGSVHIPATTLAVCSPVSLAGRRELLLAVWTGCDHRKFTQCMQM